jgi:hypothetical protein
MDASAIAAWLAARATDKFEMSERARRRGEVTLANQYEQQGFALAGASEDLSAMLEDEVKTPF